MPNCKFADVLIHLETMRQVSSNRVYPKIEKSIRPGGSCGNDLAEYKKIELTNDNMIFRKQGPAVSKNSLVNKYCSGCRKDFQAILEKCIGRCLCVVGLCCKIKVEGSMKSCAGVYRNRKESARFNF